jgi:hypothetical protein
MLDLFSDRQHAFFAQARPIDLPPLEWVEAFANAMRDANPEVQAAWDSWNNSERRLMAVISQRTMPLQGRAAQERYGISKTGGNRNTIDRLQGDGHIVADATTATGWRVVDPLLALSLANDRSWPLEE